MGEADPKIVRPDEISFSSNNTQKFDKTLQYLITYPLMEKTTYNIKTPERTDVHFLNLPDVRNKLPFGVEAELANRLWKNFGGEDGTQVYLSDLEEILERAVTEAQRRAESPNSSGTDIANFFFLREALNLGTIMGRAAASIFFERQMEKYRKMTSEAQDKVSYEEFQRRTIAFKEAINLIKNRGKTLNTYPWGVFAKKP